MVDRSFPKDVLLVASTTGLSQHLTDARTDRDKSLCGRAVSTTTIDRTPFEFVGCKRCIRIALDGGASEVQDVDGTFLHLETVLANL